mmetsp:Transcript_48958/g.95703  ORF Transcript_48958/g.95703 Transcript_48958/m.95703 type:complete len:200 (-) Transcript_48958:1060-1659(-)
MLDLLGTQLAARLQRAPHAWTKREAEDWCSFIVWMMARMPPSFSMRSLLELFSCARFHSAPHASSWMAITFVYLYMASMITLMPPLWLIKSLFVGQFFARFRSAEHPFSWIPSIHDSILSRSTILLFTWAALHPGSCSHSPHAVACISSFSSSPRAGGPSIFMASMMAWIPPTSAMMSLLSITLSARLQSAAHPFSCTP